MDDQNKEKLDINEILNNNDLQMNFEKILDDFDYLIQLKQNK